MGNTTPPPTVKKAAAPIPLHIPPAVTITKPPEPVKIATPDLIFPLKESTVPIDTMTTLIFQDIGGEEILNVSRVDLIGEEQIENQPIKDLKELYADNNPNNILSVPDGSDPYFNSFQIKFHDYDVNEYQVVNSGYVVGPTGIFSIIDAYPSGFATVGLGGSETYFVDQVTYTTDRPHGFLPPQSASQLDNTYVIVYNVNPSDFNTGELGNNYVTAVPTPTTFTMEKIIAKDTVFKQPNLTYVDSFTGDLIIEIANVSDQSTVELEIWSPEFIADSNKNKYDSSIAKALI
jgi:hypothetical protein